jgi:hypothetical protein
MNDFLIGFLSFPIVFLLFYVIFKKSGSNNKLYNDGHLFLHFKRDSKVTWQNFGYWHYDNQLDFERACKDFYQYLLDKTNVLIEKNTNVLDIGFGKFILV